MSDNKKARRKLEKIYGQICMIEELGIRKISSETRKKIKGYKEFQETITYHHIEKKSKGGKSNVANGALIKDYNHQWLHSLPEEQQEYINERLLNFKARYYTTYRKGIGNESSRNRIKFRFR